MEQKLYDFYKEHTLFTYINLQLMVKHDFNLFYELAINNPDKIEDDLIRKTYFTFIRKQDREKIQLLVNYRSSVINNKIILLAYENNMFDIVSNHIENFDYSLCNYKINIDLIIATYCEITPKIIERYNYDLLKLHKLVTTKKMIMFMLYDKKELNVEYQYFDVNLISLVFDYIIDNSYKQNDHYLIQTGNPNFSIKNIGNIIEKYCCNIDKKRKYIIYITDVLKEKKINKITLNEINIFFNISHTYSIMKSLDIFILLLDFGLNINSRYFIDRTTLFEKLFSNTPISDYLVEFEIFLKYGAKISSEFFNIIVIPTILKIILKYNSITDIIKLKDRFGDNILFYVRNNYNDFINFFNYLNQEQKIRLLNEQDNGGRSLIDEINNNIYTFDPKVLLYLKKHKYNKN